MAMSDEDYQHVVAINEQMRELERKQIDALLVVDACTKKLAALERVRDVFIKAKDVG